MFKLISETILNLGRNFGWPNASRFGWSENGRGGGGIPYGLYPRNMTQSQEFGLLGYNRQIQPAPMSTQDLKQSGGAQRAKRDAITRVRRMERYVEATMLQGYFAALPDDLKDVARNPPLPQSVVGPWRETRSAPNSTDPNLWRKVIW